MGNKERKGLKEGGVGRKEGGVGREEGRKEGSRVRHRNVRSSFRSNPRQ